MRDATGTLVIGDFPQLQLIAWNRNPHDVVTCEDAFDLYERNWRFDEDVAMIPIEHAVVERLKRKYSHGILHV